MTSAVIVAAGKGTRMGPDRDKLFLEAAGKPIILHTWQRFDESDAIDEIVLVIRDGLQEAFEKLAANLASNKPHRFVVGGKERQDSVWNGIQATDPSSELVAIQDGARPCTPPPLIKSCLEAARRTGASVAASKVSDTIKEAAPDMAIVRTVDRSHLWAVQTPQVFRREVIIRALKEVKKRGLMATDDTAACEIIGQPVSLIEGAAPNPKITFPSDIPYIEWLLAAAKA